MVGLLEVGSLTLTGAALVSATLLRRKDARGWWLTLAEQPVWMAYALWTSQYGFVVSACWYFVESVKGIRRWGKGDGVADTPPVEDDDPIVRIATTLPKRVADDFEYLVEVSGYSHADAMHRAIVVLAFLSRAEAKGGETCIRYGTDVERVHFV